MVVLTTNTRHPNVTNEYHQTALEPTTSLSPTTLQLPSNYYPHTAQLPPNYLQRPCSTVINSSHLHPTTYLHHRAATPPSHTPVTLASPPQSDILTSARWTKRASIHRGKRTERFVQLHLRRDPHPVCHGFYQRKSIVPATTARVHMPQTREGATHVATIIACCRRYTHLDIKMPYLGLNSFNVHRHRDTAGFNWVHTLKWY